MCLILLNIQITNCRLSIRLSNMLVNPLGHFKSRTRWAHFTHPLRNLVSPLLGISINSCFKFLVISWKSNACKYETRLAELTLINYGAKGGGKAERKNPCLIKRSSKWVTAKKTRRRCLYVGKSGLFLAFYEMKFNAEYKVFN